jgi:hypothetical protein
MSERKELEKFTVRSLLFLAPFLALAAPFLAFDPFRILYRYDDYYDQHGEPHVNLNRDYVSTELYLANREREEYDAFVFGNSRSSAFLCGDWAAHLDAARPFHFDAYGESLAGIWGKVRLIDELEGSLRYALLLLDRETLETTVHRGHLFIKHPAVSDNSWWDFYKTSAKAYLSDLFFLKYAYLRLFGQSRGYMAGSADNPFIDDIMVEFTPGTNDLYLRHLDEQIRDDPDAYYREHADQFQPRDLAGRETPGPVIGDAQLKQLRDIATIFRKHGTESAVVISPLYDQLPFDPEDLALLRAIFGPEQVYDYSGVNAITADLHSYFEPSHYRPNVARRILDEIYGPRSNRRSGGK